MTELTMTAGASGPNGARTDEVGGAPATGNGELVASGKTAGGTAGKKARWGGKGLTIAIAVSAIIVVMGLVLWMVQLTGGMVQTGMRNRDSWGLYITSFMFFVGLSAGGLIISSIPNAFGMKGFGDISKVAIWTSICCVCVAIGFVVVDLGGPMRLWELFVYSNLTSPLMWDILVLGTYLILSCIYLWSYLRYESGKMSHTALRVISIIAFIVAISVHTVTAWIFALAPSHEYWHTALMGPWFVASALDCGTALVLIVVIALRKAGYLELEQRNVVNLAKMLGVFVSVDLYFFACDLLTSGYFGGSGSDVVAMLTTGQLAPVFWTQMVLMAAALVLLFTPKLRTNTGVVMASILTILGVFCKRVQILVGGFQLANLTMGDVANPMTMTHWQSGILSMGYDGMVYLPTGIEVGVALGVVALGCLFLFLGLRYLPLQQVAKKSEEK
ncbi:MAG: NrfD/PsrC family molybdoenzyme membrane anchor subunit [Eggerthellaceae bacterium]|jgi:molybdopterin-containing oxidoreductase family membrane subunit